MAAVRVYRRLFRAKAQALPSRAPLYALHAQKSPPRIAPRRRRWRAANTWHVQRRWLPLSKAAATTPAGYRSLIGFWLGGLCAVPAGPSVVDSLCICNLTFTLNSFTPTFTPMGFDEVSLIPVNDLDIEFTPPCDC